jgi:23S rRNA (cytosine1962-C5)-methyltransferase
MNSDPAAMAPPATPSLPASSLPVPSLPAPSLPIVRLLPQRHRRAHHGGPWIYSNEVVMDKATKNLEPGSLVRLVEDSGAPLGVAGFNPRTLIAARLLSRQADTCIDVGFFIERIARALSIRDRLFKRPFYRLAHAEADGLPGLILDRYGDVIVIQANVAMMDQRLSLIIDALEATLSPSTILLRNDSGARAYEGLPERVETVKGSLNGLTGLEENGAHFFADLVGGQKTGWFYDQRDNRAFIADLAYGTKTIDFYAYAGGFGVLAAARGASHVTLVDRSAASLAVAMEAAKANGVASKVTVEKADAFDAMDAWAAEGRRWETVICDPPAFVKARKDLPVGGRAYRRMTKAAARLTAPGGMLLIGSCSHNMDPALFHETVARGVQEAGRQARILRFAGAGPDHPVHPFLPETQYLKAMVLALD